MQYQLFVLSGKNTIFFGRVVPRGQFGLGSAEIINRLIPPRTKHMGRRSIMQRTHQKKCVKFFLIWSSLSSLSIILLFDNLK